MAVLLENVVPWGRSLAEYRGMFALTAVDEQRWILGCADGTASFNAEMTEGGTAVREMVRVAGEVRIFPLLDLECRESVHLRPVMEMMEREGVTAVIETVNYEFQRGGNQMLRIQQRTEIGDSLISILHSPISENVTLTITDIQ